MKKDVTIESSQNSLFKILKELSASAGIKKHGQFILMGEKLVLEFLSKESSEMQKKFALQAEIIPLGQSSIVQRADVQKIFLAPALFKEIDVVGTHSHLLLLKCPELQLSSVLKSPEGLELICPLGDPANLGALTRSAAAFGVKKMILTEDASHPYHPKAVKSSAGACLKVEFSKCPAFAKIDFTSVIESTFLLDFSGTPANQFKWPKNLYLLIGEEGPGFKKLAAYKDFSTKQKITLTTQSVESLNATVAASCALYSYSIRPTV